LSSSVFSASRSISSFALTSPLLPSLLDTIYHSSADTGRAHAGLLHLILHLSLPGIYMKIRDTKQVKMNTPRATFIDHPILLIYTLHSFSQ
jgi:hypothetical protein